jgi:hypothetical protein
MILKSFKQTITKSPPSGEGGLYFYAFHLRKAQLLFCLNLAIFKK